MGYIGPHTHTHTLHQGYIEVQRTPLRVTPDATTLTIMSLRSVTCGAVGPFSVRGYCTIVEPSPTTRRYFLFYFLVAEYVKGLEGVRSIQLVCEKWANVWDTADKNLHNLNDESVAWNEVTIEMGQMTNWLYMEIRTKEIRKQRSHIV